MYNHIMDKFKDIILRYGVLLLILITPIVHFGGWVVPHITSHTFLFYGFANILVGFYIYSLIFDKSYRLSQKQLLLFLPLMLFVTWFSISGVFAVNPSLSFWSSLMRGTGLLTIYYATGVSLLLASLVRKYGKPFLYLVLQYFAVASLIVALSVWFGDEGFHIQTQLFIRSSGGGLLGNSSLAAAYLIFGIFSNLFLIFSKSIKKGWKAFAIITTTVILFSPLFVDLYGFFTDGGILGSARGATIGIIAGALTIVISYFALSKKKIIRIIGLSSFAISLVVFFGIWLQLMNPNTALHNKFTQAASGTRFLFWNLAQTAINQHPYFGYGPENYSIAFQENFNPMILNSEYGHEAWNDRAHNIYYDLGVSGGYPAVVFYTLFLLSILLAVYVAYKKDKISQLQASAIFALMVAYVLQNLFVFDSVVSILSLYMIAGLFYGLYDDNVNKEQVKKNVKDSDKVQGLKMLTGSVLLFTFTISFYYFVMEPANKVKLFGAIYNMTVDQRPSNYSRLLGGSRVGDDWDVGGFAHNAYQVYSKNPLNTKQELDKIPLYVKDLDASIKYYEEIYKTNKSDYRLAISIIHLYSTYIYLTNKSNDPTLSQHMLDILNETHELSPSNPESYWGMAQVYAWQGKLDKIIDAYQKAIAVNREVRSSHVLLIQFAQALGNKKLYNEALTQAEHDIPGFKLQ